MKFKTNAKCMGCVGAIRNALSEIAPAEKWQFDLNSPDRVMEYTGTDADDALADKVIAIIEKAGFKAERL
ncbi:MAG: heavy-metal-associated domain-containing protein [Bacteroidales bacterium]|nr:heavy-metal-associated domain-containing protein [Bacteroidales bacterium]